MKNAKAVLNIINLILLIIVFVLFFTRYGDVPAGSILPGAGDSIEDMEEDGSAVLPVEEADLPDLLPYPLMEKSYSGIARQAMINTIIPNRPRVDITTYEVQEGDNLFAIADRYALKPETVLWGNYETLRDNPQFIQAGQELRILPTDGVYYQWEQGDQLSSIAEYFKVDPKSILEWPGNDFDVLDYETNDPNSLAIEPGTWLIIPGGRRELKDWGPPAISRANPAAAKYYGSGYCGEIYEGAIGIGSFLWPTIGTYLSGYDYNPSIHPGLDIAGAEGNAVYAADSGVVVFSGWSEYGFGYLIVLDHGNGWQTAYAHLSSIAVSCGQSAARGTVIGAVGNTGNSTGAHLHFEMRSDIYGKANPWNFVSP